MASPGTDMHHATQQQQWQQQQQQLVASLQAENEALRMRLAQLEVSHAAPARAPAAPTRVANPSVLVADNSTIPAAVTHGCDALVCGGGKNSATVAAAAPVAQGEKVVPSRTAFPRGRAGLAAGEIARYSRHLLVPAVGVEAQRCILDKTCLVIGAGGLASAVLPYLAGAGVGHIKIIDFDKIETSNLHRQVLYRESQAGQSKAQCAAEAVRAINSTVRCTPVEAMLTHDNAMEVISDCNLVVDASDNPRTRYLVNDACVLAGKPLVFGSALGMEGQVSVFHHLGGPCFRCVFPTPLAAEAGRRCSDNGVLGTVPGVIGCLQATEALKVLGEFGDPLVGRLCTYDAQDGSFYAVCLRPRSKACAVCGDKPSVLSMVHSEAFAAKHGLTVARIAPPTQNEMELPTATCQEYASVSASGQEHLLLDVRATIQFAVCSVEGAVNVPLAQMEDSLEKVETLCKGRELPIYCMCRRGIDSRLAVALLLKAGFGNVKDIKGGLTEWAKEVDVNFPMY